MKLRPKSSIRAKMCLVSVPWALDGLEPISKVALDSKSQGSYAGGDGIWSRKAVG